MSTLQNLDQVLSRKQAILAGDPAGVEKQKKSGKLSACERVEMLLDGGSFVEQNMLASDAGVVTGVGLVDGRAVAVFAQDFSVMDGAVGAKQAQKIVKLLEKARKTGTPVVAIADSNGARVGEGVAALEAYTEIYAQMAKLSGVVPMITMVAGPCIGAAAIMAELSDFTVVAAKGAVLVAGPQVINSTTGKSASTEELGGAKTAVANGAAQFAAETEEAAVAQIKALLGILPQNNADDAPFGAEGDLNRMCDGLEAGANGIDVINAVCDAGTVIECGKGYTQAVTAFGCMGGRTVAFVYTGKGDICDKRMKKITRFVRFADCYSIPVVSLIDSTGLAIFGGADRQAEVMKTAAAMVYAYSEATTAKIALVVGNAIGTSYIAMGGSANADVTYAWPGTVISPVSGAAAVQLDWSDSAEKYEAEVADGVNAAAAGLVDDVIDPAATRKYLIAALELYANKVDTTAPAKKHGNMPL